MKKSENKELLSTLAQKFLTKENVDKFIREYQQMKATSFREVLETFNRTEMSIEKMFKKNNARGSKSARDIRNAISHDWSVNDIQELIDR